MLNAVHVRLAGLAIAAAGFVVGCATGATNSSSTPSGSSASDSSSATDGDTTPPPEGSGPETPQKPVNGGPSFTVASLPVGGEPTPGNDPAQQCASINLLVPVPDGVVLRLGRASFVPHGIFRVGGDACPSEQIPCTSVQWTAQSSSGCVVPTEQVTDSTETVTVQVPGTVTCARQSVCDDYQRRLEKAGGSEDQLTAVSLNPGSDGSSSNGNPSASGSADSSAPEDSSPATSDTATAG